MSNETIELIVEGGQATAGVSLSQSLGPLRINIKDVLEKINEKTTNFKGMKVPVKVIIDRETKQFDIAVETPATSELVKKELNAEKGSDISHQNKIGNLAMEQIVKIAKIKQSSMLVKSLKAAVKTVAGTCGQMGVLIESKEPKYIVKEIDKGIYDDIILAEKTEVDSEKKEQLEKEFKLIQEEIKRRIEKEKAEEEAKEKPKEEVAAKEEEKKEEKAEVKKEKTEAKAEKTEKQATPEKTEKEKK